MGGPESIKVYYYWFMLGVGAKGSSMVPRRIEDKSEGRIAISWEDQEINRYGK